MAELKTKSNMQKLQLGADIAEMDKAIEVDFNLFIH